MLMFPPSLSRESIKVTKAEGTFMSTFALDLRKFVKNFERY